MRSLNRTLCTAMLLVSAVRGLSESPQSHLTFDVAAIHPSKPGQRGGGIKPIPNGNGYIAQNMTVKQMMSVIYRVPARQITGGPDWFGSLQFDIEAKTERSYNLDDLHTMFKNLLADRFGLKFHEKVKNGPVYALVVSKSGVKMKPDGKVGDLKVPIVPVGPGEFVGTKVPLEYLCWFLGLQVQADSRPVIDETGLNEVYDFTLRFAPELPPDPNLAGDIPPELRKLPALREAVEEQLGLRLEPAKGPIHYYVIDQVQMPSEN
jgi:uncharacterized protein (TIGR03435 family)